MNKAKSNVKEQIEIAKGRLEILEEIDLLESEFGLIKKEYLQRLAHYKERLEKLSITEEVKK